MRVYVTYNLESSITSLFKFNLACEMPPVFKVNISILSHKNCKAAYKNAHSETKIGSFII